MKHILFIHANLNVLIIQVVNSLDCLQQIKLEDVIYIEHAPLDIIIGAA